MTTEAQPSAVAATPTQGGDIRTGWDWVEPSVWTDRMLTALEQGVKGGKWFSLIDKVWKLENLRAAWGRVRANHGSSGVDGQTISAYEQRLDLELTTVSEQLRQGRYVPQPVRRVWLPKPGRREKRPLGIPAVRARVVQTAIRHVIEPIFERTFAEHSYGFRPGRGCKDALRVVDRWLHEGCTWVVDADLESYFDSIPHDRLMARVEEQLADGRLLALLRGSLTAKVMDGLAEWTPEAGTPQGAVISPLLANIYLNPLDHLLAGLGIRMVRYADDFVILCRSREDAERALSVVHTWVQAEGLHLHPEKTRIVDATQPGGFDFLGYHFECGRTWPRRKSMQKLRDTVRALTRRANGNSLDTIIARLNPVLRGWFGYFKHSYRTTFPYQDGWVRRRLRAILCKRHGLPAWHMGESHRRWPNAFFAMHGLFSLTAAHREACLALRMQVNH
jgi:RNA-directed DNA polymerase